MFKMTTTVMKYSMAFILIVTAILLVSCEKNKQKISENEIREN